MKTAVPMMAEGDGGVKRDWWYNGRLCSDGENRFCRKWSDET